MQTITNELIEKYSSKVKSLRENILSVQENSIPKYKDALNNKYFNFSHDNGFDEMKFFFSELDKIKNDFLMEYFMKLIIYYQKEDYIKIIDNTPILTIFHINSNIRNLYYFKEFGIISEKDRFYLGKLTERFKPLNTYLVSLTSGDSKSCYLNESIFSEMELPLKTLFIDLFSIEDYNNFTNTEIILSKNIQDLVGYKTIKPLTKSTLYGFTHYVLSYVLSNQFKDNVINNDKTIGIETVNDCSITFDNFYNKEYYKSLIRNADFSKSLLSAEWMYHSLKEINNIDYTVVSLGYFKALEQFLYDFIKTHSGEDRLIKRMYYPNLAGKPDKIYLNDSSIKNGFINNMLDSMINFLEDYPDLFIQSISINSITNIINILHEAKKLRNGFLHKDNMSNWEIVNKSRDITYLSLYYLLGTLKIEEKQENVLHIPNHTSNDFQKLCEYLYCNNTASIYYIEDENHCYIGVKQKDELMIIDEINVANYSGVYFTIYSNISSTKKHLSFKELMEIEKKLIKLNIDDPYLIIKEGIIDFCEDGVLFSGPLRKIYEKGKFILNHNLRILD